jgi:hypothetical protein
MPVVVNYPPPSSVVVNEVTGAVTVVQSGKPGPQGIQGVPGVVTATSPATYDAPTQTVGVDQTAIAIQPSQVAGTALVQAQLPHVAYVPWSAAPNAVGVSFSFAFNTGIAFRGYVASSGTQNDFLQWNVPIAAGTYTLALAHRRSTNSPIYQVSIAGSTLATTIDGYSATVGVSTFTTITGINIVNSGLIAVRFTMFDKNASSSGFTGGIHNFTLSRTGDLP